MACNSQGPGEAGSKLPSRNTFWKFPVVRERGLRDARGFVPPSEGFGPTLKDSEWGCLASTELPLSPALELSSWETWGEFLNFSGCTFLIYS